MSDDAVATIPVDRPTPTLATDDAVAPTAPSATNGETSITKEDEDIAGKQATTEVTAPDGETTEVFDGPSAVDIPDGTPAAGKKEKRKSSAGVPEHKMKKITKKKSMPTLNLECQPGQFYWARLKGYPPWPAIICDEQMLPETLLASRPVSTARPDGSLRDDFKEGGKNAKERTYPVMFLSTNEFSWMINTALTPLDPEECKTPPKGKMMKSLLDAYQLASENHGIDYYRDLLTQWQEDERAIAAEIREKEEQDELKAAEKAAKAAAAAEDAGASGKDKKKKSRKSKGADDDTVMEDARDGPKSSKKRKKETESDAEGIKPKKTPKVMKLNAPKTPNGEAASAKKSTSKPKKKVSAPKAEENEIDEKPRMTEEEKLAARERNVLYLRHRLQKGFLTRDQVPQESEMTAMADFFSQLENFENLEPSIIRTTKIHKVLKAIVKITSIPKDEEFNFKKRSATLLEIWNKRMEADADLPPASATELKSAGPDADENAPDGNGDVKMNATIESGPNGDSNPSVSVENDDAQKADGVVTGVTVQPTEEELDEPTVSEPSEAPAAKVAEASDDAQDETTAGDVSMPTAPDLTTETS